MCKWPRNSRSRAILTSGRGVLPLALRSSPAREQTVRAVGCDEGNECLERCLEQPSKAACIEWRAVSRAERNNTDNRKHGEEEAHHGGRADLSEPLC